jgi:amidophosphoribosyltransferase
MCGLFGIIGQKPIAESIYHGMIQLQHRGQDAAGIFTYDPITNKHAIHKDLGLVRDVFTSDTLPLPKASWGIGHVRYSTIGKVRSEDTQPHYIQEKHTIAMAHNGNIINYVPLRNELENHGTIFESNCDIEVILHLFANALPSENISFEDVCNAVRLIYQKVVGAYSVVALIPGVGLVAFRDPWGIRPLLFGTKKDESSFAVASETNALTVFGCDHISDVKAGEVFFIDAHMKRFRKALIDQKPAHCSFEYNYFSKPNSIIDEFEVYSIRYKLGEFLGEKIKKENIKIDAVIPVPSTARPASIALAKTLGISYEEGFVKQDYIGRTFIMPTQKIRQNALTRKLAPVISVFKNKNVLLVDDSIVRGTVSKRVISLARWAGAKQVYFASTFPPIQHPCLYGVDFPNQEQLIAFNQTIPLVSEKIHADRLFYNDVEALNAAIANPNLCNACLTGIYPTGTEGITEFQSLRIKDLTALELTWNN